MISKVSRKIVALLAFGLLTCITEGAPSDPDVLKEGKIEKLAQTYKIDGKQTVAKFKALHETDAKKAREAAVYFEKAKAYDITALALPEIKDQYVRGYLRSVISQKKKFSPLVCQAALNELELLNAEPLELADGERVAAVANMKEELAAAVARWLTIPAPKLPRDPDKSAPGYTAFIASAKRKAATITISSPD